MPEEKPSDANNFLRLGRSIIDDVQNGLKLEEFAFAVWLQLNANPHNGEVRISYEGLSQDFGGTLTKNQVTKIIGNLKKRELIYFPKRQGKSGSFTVKINNYPLSTGGFTRIVRQATQPTGDSDAVVAKSESDERRIKPKQSEAEVLTPLEKYIYKSEALNNEYFGRGGFFGISTNNDNENENENNNEKSLQGREKIFAITRIEGETEHEKARCEEIAEALGEASPAFTRAACAQYGLEVVEEAYRDTLEANEKGRVKNLGAFFNALVTSQGKEKLRAKRALEEPL